MYNRIKIAQTLNHWLDEATDGNYKLAHKDKAIDGLNYVRDTCRTYWPHSLVQDWASIYSSLQHWNSNSGQYEWFFQTQTQIMRRFSWFENASIKNDQ